MHETKLRWLQYRLLHRILSTNSFLYKIKTNMRKIRKHQIYDTLHRTTVWGLIGLTGIGCALLVFRAYRYFSFVRPMQQERKRMLAEEQTTSEQMEKEAELLRRQKEAETLKA